MAMVFFSIARVLSFGVAWIVVWIGRLIRTSAAKKGLEGMDRIFLIEKLSIQTIQTRLQSIVKGS